MTVPEVWRQALSDARRTLLAWGGGLLAYVLLVLAFYPSIKNDPAINEVLRNLPAALRGLVGDDLTTPAGYVGGRLYSLLPVFLSVFAGLLGSAMIAGAEARGLLELPLSQPVSRRALLWGRLLALLTALLALGALLFAATWGLGALFQAPLPAERVLMATALHVLGAWVFGALALAAGAATGRAGLASALGAGLGSALLIVHTLSDQVPALRDLAGLNPWTYALANRPLVNAVGAGPLLAFISIGLLLGLLAQPFFERRDVGG